MGWKTLVIHSLQRRSGEWRPVDCGVGVVSSDSLNLVVICACYIGAASSDILMWMLERRVAILGI